MFSDSFINVLLEDDSRIGYALELILPAEISRTHTGVGEIVIDGQTYLGVGQMGSVGAVETQSDEKPVSLNLELSGIPGNLLTDALGTKMRGSDATLYVYAQSDAGQMKAAAPAVVGTIASYNVQVGDDNVIQVGIADEFQLYEKSINNFWTEQSQLALFPDDHICRFTAQMAEREISWGSKRDAPGFKYD